MNPEEIEIATVTESFEPDVSGPPTTSPSRPEVVTQMAVEIDRPARSVTLSHLNAFYGDNHAVRDVNLEFAPNKVTAIIGPSGCGKSTMVRCINRMHEEIPGARAEGSITLDDMDVNAPGIDVVAVRRAIGMVFQKPNPFPTMTIKDNVAAGIRLSGGKRADLDEHVEKALVGAGLWDEVKDRLQAPGTSLSGGQQQRLCIARAIAVNPEVILMDEPCSALDPIAPPHRRKNFKCSVTSRMQVTLTMSRPPPPRMINRVVGGNHIQVSTPCAGQRSAHSFGPKATSRLPVEMCASTAGSNSPTGPKPSSSPTKPPPPTSTRTQWKLGPASLLAQSV